MFSPSLFIGATLGAGLGAFGHTLFPDAAFSVVEYAVVGMGALVGGATGASMTAIVMIFEMTRDYNVMVPLVLAVALSDRHPPRAGHREHLHHQAAQSRPADPHHPPHQHVPGAPGARADEPELHRPADRHLDQRGAEGDRRASRRATSSSRTGRASPASPGSTAGSYAPDRYAGQTLREVVAEDFVIAPQASILNTIISRMNRRGRSLAIVVSRPSGIPRPEDVVGVIASSEIANAVIANHYA